MYILIVCGVRAGLWDDLFETIIVGEPARTIGINSVA